MSRATIALGLPHTPWVPARVESWRRLLTQLEVDPEREACPHAYELRAFTERATNKVWPRAMWGWALDTGCSHFLTLQDDVLVSPDFWPALHAMLEAQPTRIISLAAVHPLGPEEARQGHRWYRTRSWVIGWAYVLPREVLEGFVAYVDAHPEHVAASNEDEMLNQWIHATGQETWHPVPSIVDHDTSIESTYGNDDHTHRRTTVTWRGWQAGDLCSPDFWRGDVGPMLAVAWNKACWFCARNPGTLASKDTGGRICRPCLVQFMAAAIGSG